MRIATKILIVVLVCLLGAGISSSVVFYYYSDLEASRYQREISQLSLREAENFHTITAQWFVTIDLFFFEKQSYLATGIKKQAEQMLNVLNVIRSYNNSDDQAVFDEVSTAINVIHGAVDKASILRNQEGIKWNQYIDLMDEQAIIIIDEIEVLAENYQEIANINNQQYTEKRSIFSLIIWIAIAIYLTFVFISWFWASKNIAKPVEELTRIARHANTDEGGLSFILQGGSKEVDQLGKSFQHFYEKLIIAKQKSENRKQELQKSLDELTETRLQLIQSEKLASVGQLASGVAHEINNPIGFISSNFNTLKSYSEDLSEVIEKQNQCLQAIVNEEQDKDEAIKILDDFKEQKDVNFIIEDLSELLNDSHTGLERVKKIVADLLEFSNVGTPDLTEVKFNELIDKIINTMDKSLIDGINIRRDFKRIPDIMGHGDKLGQALMNVLSNACEAIQRKKNTHGDFKGIIQIKTLSKGTKVYIDIQDNGTGIDEVDLARIFDPFFTKKPIGDGTGLGLHLAQSVMDNHQGSIFAISRVNQGTKFRIEIPITQKV